MSNIVTANFAKGRTCVTARVFQYNAGMMLRFKNVDLPDNYRVDFANGLNGTSTSVIGNRDGVEIPYQYFIPGTSIYAWIVLNTGENDAVTQYQAEIPIDPRAKPAQIPMTIAQETAINQLLYLMQSNVEHYPKIIDDYWYAWDAETQEFINTGVRASGDSITVEGTTLVIEPMQAGKGGE